MKHILVALTLFLVPAVAFASGHPAPRTVLVESFTNISCGGCADANEVTQQYVEDHGRHEMVNLQYHVNWPHPADPYYLAAPDAGLGRAMYYAIGNTPALKADGAFTQTGSYPALDAAVQAGRAGVSPMRLAVTQIRAGLDLDVTVDLEAVATVPAGDHVLRVAVVELSDVHATPPGSNGETDFHWTMRAMLPSHAGTPLSLTEGQSLSLPFETTLDAAWADTDLEVIAWVQDDATRTILQTATTAARDPYAMDYYSDRYGAVVEVGSLSHLHSWLENSGTETDTYDVHLDDTVPGDWVVSTCAGTACYPFWIRDFTVTLEPGESIELLIDITPASGAASGDFTYTVTSQNDPSVSMSRDFTAISAGSDVLFVDADGGEALEGYFTDALTATGASWNAWDHQALGLVTGEELSFFETVIWNAGSAQPAVAPADREALAEFLGRNGSLLLSGQDVAFDLADPASPNHTPETQAWYEDHTGASFVADDSHDTGLIGVADDPIGDGLSFSIAGGDGANNQGYPDVLLPASNARAVLEYSPGQAAAVRFLLDRAHVVTLGFGFEGIASAADRTQFLQNVLAWFAVTQHTGVGDAPGIAALHGAPAASPNPFNPATTISFAVAGAGRVPVAVDVFDLRGQRVRSLDVGDLAAGDHAVTWDGRADDGAAMPSGAYLARVRAGEDARTLKLVLAK